MLLIIVSAEIWWFFELFTVAAHAPPSAPLQGGNRSVTGGGLGAAVADGEFWFSSSLIDEFTLVTVRELQVLVNFIYLCLVCWWAGLAFGTGSAVAHRAVDAVIGPRVIHHESVASSAPAAAPASNSSSLGGADACAGQIKAIQDVWIFSLS